MKKEKREHTKRHEKLESKSYERKERAMEKKKMAKGFKSLLSM
jgi:hypothetical protein